MIFFAKILIILFALENIKGEIQFCDSKNEKCNIDDMMFSDGGGEDLSTLVKQAVKYFHDLSQTYSNKLHHISADVDLIKKSLKSQSQEYISCPNAAEPTTESQDTDSSILGIYDNLWVIIQRRQEGLISFYRSWDHYKRGFGNTFREFFIGLDKIHKLTSSRPHELLIQMQNFTGNISYALYDDFLVGNESEKYQLKRLGEYSGNAGDYLRMHVGMFFSTKDRDNDNSPNLHCAKKYLGGWWYNNCVTSNLNGPFRRRYSFSDVGMTWGTQKYNETQVKIVQMMIRSKPKVKLEASKG